MNISEFLMPVPLSDWLKVFFLGLGISLLIAFAEFLRRWKQLPTGFTRKLIHIAVGLGAFFYGSLIGNRPAHPAYFRIFYLV